MRYLTRFRYWLIGLLTLIMCFGEQPAIAYLSGSFPGVSHPQIIVDLPTDLPENISSHGSFLSSPPLLAVASSTLEQEAQQAYSHGQYQQAIELLQQVQEQYQQQGDIIRSAIALSNLSLAHQQLGHWEAAEASITQAREQLTNQPVPQGVEAQILDVRGQLLFAQGQLESALTTWQQTAELYGQLGDTQRQSLSRLHQAQTLQAQGLFQQVARTLSTLEKDMADAPDSALKADTLRQLGDSLRATGNLEQARLALKNSLDIAQRLESPPLMAAATLSLGNLEQSQMKVVFEREDRDAALDYAQRSLAYYQQVTRLSNTGLDIEAHLNLIQLLAHPLVEQWGKAISFYPAVKTRLDQLEPGRETIYGYTGLAETLITIKQKSRRSDLSWTEIINLLTPAQQQAQALGDKRSQSLVLGTLGSIYQQNGQWANATTVLRQARDLAQEVRADDISYRWQWQLGRIFRAEGKQQAAINAYTDAFNTLKSIRSDLISANPDVRFSFREQVEPIYRELVDLLLSSVPPLPGTVQARVKQTQPQSSNKQDQAYLAQAQEVMESLQVAALENFFQAACIEQTVSINTVVDEDDPTAAVLSTILLDDRLEVVLKLPRQDGLIHYAAPVSGQTISRILTDYHFALTDGADALAYGQRVYDWLLRPAVEQRLLSPETIKTLIFILDGDLRRIPMATLHDGQNFLIQNYALSLILGSEVRDPQVLDAPQQLDVLATSLTNPPAADANLYAPLLNVNVELDKIVSAGLSANLLRDEAFTSQALEQALNTTDYSIVHLATHGQFGRDRKNTFILAADGRIDIDTLGQVFQSRRQADTNLEMLILSACKTATGDSREVLGIAGAAVQSGARSTIATLWSVDDAASVVFTDTLYSYLGQPETSRAEALRQAQLELLRQYPGRPRYWAPYVLVGSWR